jgi:hypothetical protein
MSGTAANGKGRSNSSSKLRRTSNAEKFVKRPVMQLGVRVDEAAAVDPGAAVVRWQTREIPNVLRVRYKVPKSRNGDG